MEHRLDTLAKTLSGTLSRREAIRRVGIGLGAAVLVSLGLRTEAAAASGNDCGKLCAECCVKNLGLRGRELAECMQACHAGEGLCGPIVCPDGMH
jgi:hypothetical protein